MNRVIRAWHRFNHQFPSALTRFRRNMWWYHLRPKLWVPLWREVRELRLSASTLKYPTNMRFEQQLHQWRGPHHRKSPYECGVDTQGFQGMPSAFLRSKDAAAKAIETYGFRARLAQVIKADAYRGKRLRFSGEVKAEQVEQQAGLMVDILFPPSRKLAERWRQERPERSTQGQPGGWRPDQEQLGQGTRDWMNYETTISVPEQAQYLRFGLILYGTGQIWLTNAHLVVIEQDGMPSA
jgi:hypothetical protein